MFGFSFPVFLLAEDDRSFVLSVIEGHTQQTDVLDEKQQLLFFEAVGHIVSATRKSPKP